MSIVEVGKYHSAYTDFQKRGRKCSGVEHIEYIKGIITHMPVIRGSKSWSMGTYYWIGLGLHRRWKTILRIEMHKKLHSILL